MVKTCSVKNCEKPAKARGWCGNHWLRWRKYGDPDAPPVRKPMPKHCAVDGCGLKSSSRHKGVAYCNKHYLRMHLYGRIERWVSPGPKEPGECSVTGCSTKARSAHAKYCEMHYGRLRRNGHLELIGDKKHYMFCGYCGSPTKNGNEFCNATCRTRSVRSTPIERECIVCGESYNPTDYISDSPNKTKGRDRLVCSDLCDKIRTQAGYDARRPVEGSSDTRPGLRLKVFERDRWVCQICGEPTDRTVEFPHPLYPTIDHIVPIKLGGSHTLDNLQCAHSSCNCKKHAIPPDDKRVSSISCSEAA